MDFNFNEIELFLLDMDGTIYLDESPIPGAADFIATLLQKQVNYVFLTNNSSKSSTAYLQKLHRLGFHAQKDNIFTSGQACGIYLCRQKKSPRVYLVGTDDLKNELGQYGITVCTTQDKNIDFVVVGYDTQLTYEKLTHACHLLEQGIPFIATNCDTLCPTGKNRFLPDCGLICHMLTEATQKKPHFIGKPKPDMITLLLQKYQIRPQNALMIGDRLYTDIAAGYHAGIRTCCVLSGEADQAAIDACSIKPDIVLNSVADIRF